MEEKNYYKTLGIEKSATADEIKKAYRTLAKKFHPDLNQNNKAEAEKKFKEVSEAYEVLIDTEKRKMFDQYGYEGVSQQFGQGGFHWEDFTHADDVSDIFRDIFGNARSGQGSSIFDMFFNSSSNGQSRGAKPDRRGGDIKISLKLTLEEMFSGDSKTIKYSRYEKCNHCKGSGALSLSDVKKCNDCGGTGERKFKSQSIFGTVIQVGTCPTCAGDGTIVEKKCKECFGEGRVKIEHTVKVNVPPGVYDNSYMRLEGEGNVGKRSGHAGDLIIVFAQMHNDKFIREDENIITDEKISYPQAVLGTEIEIESVDKKRIKLRIPEGTESGKVFVLKGKGMPQLHSKRFGDLYVRVHIDIPKKVNSKTKNLLKELDKSFSSEN